MLKSLLVILACQLAGEFAVKAVGLAFPGAVLGMLLLFGLLSIRGRISEELEKVGDGLLGNLSLLFVPAGVGIMSSFAVLRANLLPLLAAIACSSLLTIAVTAFLMAKLARSDQDPDTSQGIDRDG